jgi:hypothetical protein
MAVYKESDTNTWRVIYRYTDWMGARKQTSKRGFSTKRDAMAWEREQLQKTKADLDMTFESFVQTYTTDDELQGCHRQSVFACLSENAA